MSSDSIKFARDWPLEKLERTLRSGPSSELADFIYVRHIERFFEPIDLLIKASEGSNKKTYGFAVVSLCCLLIETLQCYEWGLPSTYIPELKNLLRTMESVPEEFRFTENDIKGKNGPKAFKTFFLNEEHKNAFSNLSGEHLYSFVRNGLLHQAQTKNGWKIKKGNEKVWTEKILYRDKFAAALREVLVRYVAALRSKPYADPSWVGPRRKIYWLIHTSK